MKIREFVRNHLILDYMQKMIRGLFQVKFRAEIMDYIRNPFFFVIRKMGDLNKGRIVYLIECRDKSKGFFAQQRLLLYHLAFAEEVGFCPVVLYQEEFLYFDKTYVQNTMNNGYEYYFEKVSNISVEEALKSYNVVKSQEKYLQHFVDKMDYTIKAEEIDFLSKMHHKYIKLNSYMQNKMENEWTDLLKRRKTLGVHLRGTDFRQEFNNHPIFIDVNEFADSIVEIYEKGSYEQVFVATDDLEMLKAFEKRVGKIINILYYKDVLRNDGHLPVTLLTNSRENHRFLLGYEALRDAYTLSQCDGFVGGLSQLSIYTQIIKRARNVFFEDILILDKGMNHNYKSAYYAGKKKWNGL